KRQTQTGLAAGLPARLCGYAPAAEREPHRFGAPPTGYVRPHRRAWPVAAVGRRVVELDGRADEREPQRAPERALHGVGDDPEAEPCPSSWSSRDRKSTRLNSSHVKIS